MTPQRRIYLDNAATSFPKPPGVAQAVQHYLTQIGASAGRGAYREAVESGRILARLREKLRTLFAAGPDDAVIFTLNGTDALNTAIRGLIRPGDHVVTTAMDHNSVLRPLVGMQQRDRIEVTIVEPPDASTRIAAEQIAAALRPQTRAVVFNHASNVTGVLQPLADVAELCRRRGVLLIVDAAQSAGHVPIDFSALGLAALAMPGHKGLLGPLGTGVLILRADLIEQTVPLREGGTGSVSEEPRQPDFAPDKFESGSHNAVGLAGLLAAVEWIEQQTLAALRRHELELCHQMLERLGEIPGLRLFGPRDPQQRVGVFSVRIDGFEPHELSALLESQFGILTRSGLHCAPLAHRAIGTLETGGTTRLSFGPFVTANDIEHTAKALRSLAAATVG